MTEEQLAATLAAVVTPQRLHAELDARRHELGVKAWPWWRVAIALDISVDNLRKVRHGHLSPALRARAVAWLERKPAPPRAKTHL
jgi:hypothetical protein